MVIVPRCKCCGHPLPPPEHRACLSPQQREIFDLVAKAGKRGITAKSVFDRLFQLDPNGGPDSGTRGVYTQIFHINEKFTKRKIRMRVRANYRSTGARYFLETT